MRGGQADRVLTGAVCCRGGDSYVLNGRFRQGEDAVLEQCAPSILGVFAVLGGLGEQRREAARLAARQLAGEADALRLDTEPERALAALARADEALDRTGRESEAVLKASVLLAVTEGNGVDLYSAGDCRAYLYRQGVLTRLLRSGGVGQQYLGAARGKLHPLHHRLILPPGGRLVLTSAALTPAVEEKLTIRLRRRESPQVQAAALVKLAGGESAAALVIAHARVLIGGEDG